MRLLASVRRRPSADAVGAVVARLAEAVVVFGPDGEPVHVNAAAEALLAGSPRGPAGLRSERTRLTGEPVDGALVALPGPDGGEDRWLTVSTRRLHDDDHPPHAVIASLRDVTEERRTAAALRTARARFESVVDQLHEGVVVHGRDGTILSANPRSQELLGLDLDQLRGRSSLDPRWRAIREDGSHWPGETHPSMVVLATGEAQLDQVMGIYTPDGELRWLLINAMPSEHDGVVVSFIDVTARRAAEHRLRVTLDALREGVVFFDAGGTLQDVNPSARRVLGGEGAAALVRQVVVAGRGGAVVTDDLLRAEVDGEARFLEVSAVPLWDEAGPDGPWPVVASFTDVTDRHRRDQALRDAEVRFRTLFASAPIGMAMVRPDGRIVDVNDAFAAITGRPADELVQLGIDDITHPEDLGEDLEQLDRVLAGEQEAYRLEQRYLHALGHLVWVQLDVAAVRGQDGELQFLVGMVQDITDRRRHQDQLEHLADHDALTGLLNRRGFTRELERHAEHAHRYGAEGSLLMLDLDHFKYINDTLGHKAGDELIVDLADTLVERLRSTDVIARLGGDEFAVLLPKGGAKEAEGVARSILDAIRERPPMPGAEAVKVSASVGIALFDATAGADALMVSADLAMYDAKEAGRDRFASAVDEVHARPRSAARINWVNRIRAALDQGGLRLVAQPIHELHGGPAPVMHELLLRMEDGRGALVKPASFLYVAERFDLIQDIDRWVLGQAAALLGAARRQGRHLVLSANVSGRSLAGPGLVEHLAAELERHDADAEALVLEITETSAVEHIHHARTFAHGVRDLGCRVAIDDFGAGFGSFYYLKHLPFDLLKIDGEFVTNAPRSRADRLIVEAVRDLAHGMDRQVVAEFCATPELHEWLGDHGIDLVQGYHLGRPAPVEDLLAGLAAA